MNSYFYAATRKLPAKIFREFRKLTENCEDSTLLSKYATIGDKKFVFLVKITHNEDTKLTPWGKRHQISEKKYNKYKEQWAML